MFGFAKKFIGLEDGAVTVDWVVLTAAVAGLCIGFIVQLKEEGDNLSFATRDYLVDQDPAAVAGRNLQD